MQFQDYYKVLGVEPGDSDASIKQAYRRLARKCHPDVSKEPDAEARFKAINEAWEVLRDRDRRSAYDELRRNYREGQTFRPPPDWNGFQGDFGGGSGGDFSDFFETLFGQRGGFSPGPGPRPPRSLRASIQLTLEQAFEGGQQRIGLNGRNYDVRIPAGITAGQVIRLAGQAHGGGDILLEVGLAPHPVYEPDGRDISSELRVPAWTAALGGTVSVPTLGGPVNLRIPAGTGSGKRLRLKGRGLPGSPAGDHYVRIAVDAPVANTEAQQQAYRALAQAFGETAAG